MDVAIIGFGGVGQAFISLLCKKRDYLKNKNIELNIKYIIHKSGGLYNKYGIDIEDLEKFLKEGNLLSEYCGYIKKDININNIIKNKDVDILIEVTTTNIKDGEPGLTHIKLALENSINVVTGNKGPIILKYNELKEIALKNNVHLGIGCTTGGALPSINGGIFDIAGSELISIEGILNGTSNYILTQMYKNNISYKKALEDAQKLGIAELDSSLDISGFDTACKIIILGNILMGASLNLNNIDIQGIENITIDDVIREKSNKRKIKLIGKVYSENNIIKGYVKPVIIDSKHPLYFVDDKNKGVFYSTDTLGDISIIGGASGTINAAAAIFRDIINIINGISY
ncbi:homoserine dehydrogenase [Clostridium carnis]